MVVNNIIKPEPLVGDEHMKDRYFMAIKQACERHGRLWTALVRCNTCGYVQVSSVPAKWGFGKSRCAACQQLGAEEVPAREFHAGQD